MKNRSITKKTVVAAFNVTAHIARQILVIRGQKVMIDADLAALYDVPTKRLNEQVKRNPGRFPGDFVFALTRAERDEVVANCDHLQRLKFSPTMPFAFRLKGAGGGTVDNRNQRQGLHLRNPKTCPNKPGHL